MCTLIKPNRLKPKRIHLKASRLERSSRNTMLQHHQGITSNKRPLDGIDTPANKGIVGAMHKVDARTVTPNLDIVRDI